MLTVSEPFFSKSDIGVQRRSNEDSVYARAPLFAVADGMGGARAGEVASGMVVDVLRNAMPDQGSDKERLAECAREANRRIHERAQTDPAAAGMGTTFTAAWVGEDAVSVAHVGDSRAYRLRDGQLEQMTRDHSLVGELVRSGKLTEEAAEDHPQRSVITRALGPEPEVEVDTWTFAAQPGDVWLLCSDGLNSMVDDAGIARALDESPDLRQAGQALIDEANRRGGRDNITVILFRLEEAGVAVAGGADPDQPTEVGMQPVTVVPAGAGEEVPAAPPQRTAPLPPREDEPPRHPKATRRRRRAAGPVVAVLAVVALVAAGGWIASRAVYFVGTDDDGFVAVYRGLPYDGPLGTALYEAVYVSSVAAATLPPDRRDAILDHELRSSDDARDLVRALEVGRVASERP